MNRLRPLCVSLSRLCTIFKQSPLDVLTRLRQRSYFILVLANIGHCNWQDVPKFAEAKVRDLLRFIFPNENLDNARDIISRDEEPQNLYIFQPPFDLWASRKILILGQRFHCQWIYFNETTFC